MMNSEYAARRYYAERLKESDLSEQDILAILRDPHHTHKRELLRVLRENKKISANVVETIVSLLDEEDLARSLRKEMWACLEGHMTPEMEIRLLLEQSEDGVANDVDGATYVVQDESARWIIRALRVLLKDKLNQVEGKDFIFDE